MSGLERIKDFARWLRDVQANLGGADAPKEALALVDGAPVLMRRDGAEYSTARPAQPGDKRSIFLNEDSALTTLIKVNSEAAVFGVSAARIEAAKASPFPLEDGAYALAPSPSAWGPDGADWLLAAAPRQRIDEIRTALTNAGARPGDAFAMAEGQTLMMRKPSPPRLTIVAGLITIAAGIGAALSVTYGAAAIEDAAQARLTEARHALSDAEAAAAAAQTRRDDAAGPLRQAQIVGAALDRAPSVAGPLAALTVATPDTAYLKRLTIGPDVVTGEFIAPDAAALAVGIGESPAFASARLKGAARTEANSQQRATLEILPRASE